MDWLDKADSIFILSDAAIDEYLATLFVASLANGPKIAGEIIVNADCIADPAMVTGIKIRHALDLDIPLGLSAARGWNPFPWQYREDCIRLGNIDLLREIHIPDQAWADGDAMLRQYLEGCAPGEAVILCMCPPTPLTNLLRLAPELSNRIGGMIWMGGALNVPGNLDPATLPPSVWNKSAEWNVFWDPASVDWLFRHTDFPLLLAPLDASDPVMISSELLQTLREQAANGSKLSELAAEAYSLVAGEKFYRLWDVVSALPLLDISLFSQQELQLEVIDQGQDQGTLRPTEHGRAASVLTGVTDLHQLYARVCAQFKRL